MALHLLIVDDDDTVRASLGDALRMDGLRVSEAADGQEALDRLAGDAVDLVLSDVRMPGLDGLELLRRLRERAPAVEVVLMTAYDDPPVLAAAARCGARGFLVKPLDLGNLRDLINQLIADRG
jgi:two-component system, response regulator, stage 0 sporulation protein F